MIPRKENLRIQKFVNGLKDLFRERLESIILYGSIARGTYVSGKSDINLIALVDSITMDDLLRMKTNLAGMAFRYAIKPVLFTPEFFASSIDAFPIEWQEIKQNHLVLYGADYTGQLEINSEHLRLCLERETKQIYLRFQQGLIFRKDISSLLQESCKSLRIILTHMKKFISQGIEMPAYLDIMDDFARGRRKRLAKSEVFKLSSDHLGYLERLISMVDGRIQGKQ